MALFDWELSVELAATAPLWTPGTAHGESALFYGHLVGARGGGHGAGLRTVPAR